MNVLKWTDIFSCILTSAARRRSVTCRLLPSPARHTSCYGNSLSSTADPPHSHSLIPLDTRARRQWHCVLCGKFSDPCCLVVTVTLLQCLRACTVNYITSGGFCFNFRATCRQMGGHVRTRMPKCNCVTVKLQTFLQEWYKLLSTATLLILTNKNNSNTAKMYLKFDT